MAYDQHTVLICTTALRQDTNNMWRGLSNSIGIPYDASPVNSLPGTCGVPLAVTLDVVNPWFTTPTHWLASAWELPDYETLLASLKAGNIPTREWLTLNLTQNRARTAAQSLYSRTQGLQPGQKMHVVVAENIAAALIETGLNRVPNRPIGGL